MTTELLTLFDETYEAQRELTIAERFSVFHLNNPQVFKTLEEMTQEVVDRGRSRISIKTLIENMRWNFYMRTTDPNSDFKINNSYSALYARLLMDTHPEWGQIFELREVHDRSAFLVRR